MSINHIIYRTANSRCRPNESSFMDFQSFSVISETHMQYNKLSSNDMLNVSFFSGHTVHFIVYTHLINRYEIRHIIRMQESKFTERLSEWKVRKGRKKIDDPRLFVTSQYLLNFNLHTGDEYRLLSTLLHIKESYFLFFALSFTNSLFSNTRKVISGF